MSDSPPLVFEDVRLPEMGDDCLSFETPARSSTVLISGEARGVDRLGAVALGLDRAVEGRALVFGEDIGRLSRRDALAFRRRVGYLPAGDGLLHNLSLEDNVALPLRFGSERNDREIEGRIRVLLAMLGIADAARLRPSHANDEQRRRAAVARALVFDPRLVILERPFGGVTEKVAAELLELARGGLTAEGSRRTLFITGPYLPGMLRPRVEHRLRIVGGRLQQDD